MSEKYMPAKKKVFDKYKVMKIPMDAMWQSCRDAKETKPQFFKNLQQMLIKDGMMNPIIVIQGTVATAWERKKIHKQALLDPPGDADPAKSDPPHEKPLYIIWGGNNRFTLLKEMGYTHVDCVVIPNGKNAFQEAFRIQNLQRKSFPKLR